MKYLTRITLCLVFALTLSSCEQKMDITQQELKVLEAPDYLANTQTPFPATTNFGMDHFTDPRFAGNLNEKIHLGRVLFYDKSLSANDRVSCGTCHRQEFAFSDPFRHSVGIGSQLSARNTPSIVNVRFSQGLFWDQSSENMLSLSLEPVKNHREMGFSNMHSLILKLYQQPYYPPLFEKAFGDPEITEERLAMALTEFCGQLNSFDSDVDFNQLSPLAERGRQLFVEKGCNDCHNVMNDQNPAILDNVTVIDMTGSFAGEFSYTGATQIGSVANIGLNSAYEDQGVGSLNGNSDDNGKFKIPSLRNVARTAPYMHDGRFATLDEVLDFYSEGVRSHENLDERMLNSDGSVKRLNLTSTEKEAIKSFLTALNSKDLITNDLYSSPFEG